MITIVDYGMGNLRSVEKALEHLGVPVQVSGSAKEISQAERLVVPGVGAFGDAMAELQRHGLVDVIRDYAASGRPVLGICLGMQILFPSSEEAPGVEGLGLLQGQVLRFQPNGMKVPHMGWNKLEVKPDSRLLRNLPEDPHVYFVHSYYVKPEDPADVAGQTPYGQTFASVVERGNIGGVQFHPEKSQAAGLCILKNFAGLQS